MDPIAIALIEKESLEAQEHPKPPRVRLSDEHLEKLVPDSSLIVNVAANYAKKIVASYDASHDWHHLLRVLANARKIAKEEAVDGNASDLELVELAALLHDVGDHKYLKGDETEDDVLQELVNVLKHYGYADENKLQHLLTIIKNISFSKQIRSNQVEKSLELRIVQDADRLDAIGAIGIARCLTFGGARNRPLYNDDTPNVTEWIEKGCPIVTHDRYNTNNAASIDHFFEKLLHLKNLMNTNAGLRIAEQRHEFMLKFLNQFFDEINI